VLGLIAIVGGYLSLLWLAGPVALVAIVAHIAIMLLASWRRK
jgi:hypothetical protein